MARHALAAVGLLLQASVLFGSELSDDLSARRARLMERLGPDAMVVLFSAPEVGSSRVDLQACKLEYSIVSPK